MSVYIYNNCRVYTLLVVSYSENQLYVLCTYIYTHLRWRDIFSVGCKDFLIFNIYIPFIIFLFYLGPVKVHFADCENPVDYFMKYFNEQIIDSIIFQSNLYIHQSQKRVPILTKAEFYGFIGINMVMGYHELPSWKHYWNQDPDLSVPFISSVLSRNRFLQILSNIHLNDNNAMPEGNTDKLYKLRPLIDSLNNQYAKLYSVSRYVSVDESMILFKGRSSLKQYNPMKPIKRGYKLWSMADMDGYLYKFEIYQGKNNRQIDATMPKYFGLGDKVIYQMTKSLHGKFHEVYVDNFFTSVPLMEYLLSHQVLCCGTLRANKKYLPKNLSCDKDLKMRGDFDYRVSKDDIVVYKWQDNKPVHFISNFHGTEETEIKRKNKDGSIMMIPSPHAVKDYNKYMGGVDKADMYCALYGTSRKSKKWWHRIFFGLVDRSVCNAYVVYKKLKDEDISLLNFRRSVTQSMITKGRPVKLGRPLVTGSQLTAKRRKSNYSVPASIRKENLGIHWPEHEAKRGRCEVCSKKKLEARPFVKCSACKVYLCISDKRNCFKEYHQ